jgi:hypothetical protein
MVGRYLEPHTSLFQFHQFRNLSKSLKYGAIKSKRFMIRAPCRWSGNGLQNGDMCREAARLLLKELRICLMNAISTML